MSGGKRTLIAGVQRKGCCSADQAKGDCLTVSFHKAKGSRSRTQDKELEENIAESQQTTSGDDCKSEGHKYDPGLWWSGSRGRFETQLGGKGHRAQWVFSCKDVRKYWAMILRTA